jgi:copper transport protein
MTFSRLLGILVLALALLPAQARAHLKLASSKPAQGDTVREPVSSITLTFTEAVDERYTTISVLDAFGQDLAVGAMFHAVGSSPSKEYMVMFSTPLAGGAFTVKWKTLGKDGHAVTGMFDFLVDVGQSIAPKGPPVTATPGVHAPEHGGHHAAEIPELFRPESSIVWIIARWLNFCGLLLMVGAVAFRFGVLERTRNAFDAALSTDIDEGVRRLAIFAAAVAIAANLARLWLQYGSLHGSGMWQSDLLAALLLDGGWGRAWLAQTFASLGFLIAAGVRTEDRSDSWYSALPFAVVAASTPAFAGHAAAVQQMAIVPIGADAIHIITAAAWLGTLAVMMVAAVPRVLRTDDGFAKVAVLVRTFSPFALAMAGIAVFTGTVNALVHIGAVSELWSTSYGRVLALKVGVVLLTLTIGAYNWKVVKPGLGTEVATADLRRSARTEIAMAVIIVIITAVLVATPTN